MKIICRRSKTVFCFCLLWYRRSKSRLMLWAFTGRFRPRKQLSVVVNFKGPSGKSRGNLFMIFHQRSFRMKTIRILQNSRAIAAETKRLTQKFPRFLKQQFIVSGWMRNYITNISTFRAEAAVEQLSSQENYQMNQNFLLIQVIRNLSQDILRFLISNASIKLKPWSIQSKFSSLYSGCASNMLEN